MEDHRALVQHFIDDFSTYRKAFLSDLGVNADHFDSLSVFESWLLDMLASDVSDGNPEGEK